MKIYQILEAIDIKQLANGSWGLVDTTTGEPFNSKSFSSAGAAEEFRDRAAQQSRPRPPAADANAARPPSDQANRAVRSGPNRGAVVNSIDRATGKMSGTYADGTEFRNKTPRELRTPQAASRIRNASSRILRFAKASVMFKFTSALQIGFIWTDAAQKLAEVKDDMENFRFDNQDVRQQYYDFQMASINKAKWVNTAVTVLANLAGVVGTSKAMTAVRALTMFTRFGGPIGWIISTLLFAISQGAVFMLSWTISKYGEELANWIWDSSWEVLTEAAGGAADAVVGAVRSAAGARGFDDQSINLDRRGRLKALQQDLQNGLSLDPNAQRVADQLNGN